MSVQVETRKLAASDAAECVEIGRESGLSYWSHEAYLREVDRPDSIAIVAVVPDRIEGFIVGRVIGTEAEIYNVAARYDRRRLGIGTVLLNTFVDECVKHNVHKIWLEVRASNSTAISFYARHDFVQVAVRKGFYSDPNEDARVMCKKLQE